MRNRQKTFIAFSFTIACLLFVFGNLSSQESAAEYFEKALYYEDVQGDLQKAIELYEQILKQFPENRAIAGKAQLQIGMCYEKLGKEEAIKAYELVLKNFGDQPELVASAQARIAVLQMKEPIGPVVEKLPKVMESVVFSRDGTKIAGIDWTVPGQNISVYDYTTDKLTPITHFDWTSEGHGWTYNPIFSPDAQQVAYQFAYHDKSGIELRASTLGGKDHTLYRITKGTIFPCDWLPDGSAILMLVKTEGKSWELGLIPVSGGEFNVLRSFDDFGGLFEARPAASPDGRFIVFDEGPRGKRDIKVITLDGEMVGDLTIHPADDSKACWSPDGRHIAFISNRHGNRALWGIEVKEGKPAGKPFMIRPGMRDTGLIGWTSRGIACSTFVMTRDIFIMPVNPKTGEPLDEARMLDYTPTGENTSPVWSPDGKHLAFVSLRDDSIDSSCIVVIPASGGEARKYPIPVKNFQGLLHLRWLPDSSGLGGLTRRPLETGAPENTLFQLELETGEWKSWPFPLALAGTWGKEGKSYIYEKRETNAARGLVERDLSTGKEKYIYHIHKEAKAEVIRNAKFSLDYKKLVFQIGNYDLVVLDVETGEANIVGSDFMSPVWSPDGRLILALDSWEGGWPKTMYVLPAEGGPRKELNLGSNLPKDCHLMLPDWSPDGKQIAFVTRYTIHEAFLLKNVIPKK